MIDRRHERRDEQERGPHVDGQQLVDERCGRLDRREACRGGRVVDQHVHRTECGEDVGGDRDRCLHVTEVAGHDERLVA
jgi:hypothetical protein